VAKKKAKPKPLTEPTRRGEGSRAIRDYFREHPKATSKEVVQALSKRGIVVDENLPATIKSRDKKGRTSKSPPAAVVSPQDRTPSIVFAVPDAEQMHTDVARAKTHSSQVKGVRVMISRLNRLIEMLDALRNDDWRIETRADEEGLVFVAQHAQVESDSLARARIAKLGIKPNEVAIE
jgi:hypothetical protein